MADIPKYLNPPTFEANIYTISPFGAAVLMNSAYYADANAANALAVLYGATPAQSQGSPELPVLGGEWVTVQVPESMLPWVIGGTVPNISALLSLRSLPAAMQWVLDFSGSTSAESSKAVVMNAGYLAGYWKRNPPDEFPGLADKFCRAILAAEGVTGL